MAGHKEIEAALAKVRDTRETVCVGPYEFSYEFDRGAARCRYVKRWTGRDVFAGTDYGTWDRTSVGGFAFSAVSLKRIARNLAVEAA